jgi:hypothetical protein
MATLLNADLPSDDEDDETFEPGKAPGGGGGGGKGGGRGAGKGAKRGFMEVSDGDDDADNDDDGGAATAGQRHSSIAEGLADAMDDARYHCGAAAWHQSEAEPANSGRREPAHLPPHLSLSQSAGSPRHAQWHMLAGAPPVLPSLQSERLWRTLNPNLRPAPGQFVKDSPFRC